MSLHDRLRADRRHLVQRTGPVEARVHPDHIVAALDEMLTEERADVAVAAGDEHSHPAASTSRPLSSRASAAARTEANSSPDRSATSRSEWCESAKFSTQSRASSHCS